MHLTQNEET